jgi:hypothetical protein
MTEHRYLELQRIARQRIRCMQSARSAAYRAAITAPGFARDHTAAIVREQVYMARLYARRLAAGVRRWNQDADRAYQESGAIVCKLSPRLVASTVTQ